MEYTPWGQTPHKALGTWQGKKSGKVSVLVDCRVQGGIQTVKREVNKPPGDSEVLVSVVMTTKEVGIKSEGEGTM